MEEERAKESGGSEVPEGAREPESGGPAAEEAPAAESGAAALYERLCAARAAGRWVRLLIVLLLLAVILGEVYYGYAMFRRTAEELRDPKAQALAMAEMRPIVERARSDAVRMVKDLRPVYLEEFRNQADERWPEIKEKLMAEAKTYGQNVAAQAEDMLKERVERLGQAQRDRLAKELGLDDPKKQQVVLENLQTALRGAIVDVLWDRIGQAEERIRRIHGLAVKFLPEERQAGFQQRVEKLWDQFSEQINSARQTMEKADEELKKPKA